MCETSVSDWRPASSDQILARMRAVHAEVAFGISGRGDQSPAQCAGVAGSMENLGESFELASADARAQLKLVKDSLPDCGMPGGPAGLRVRPGHAHR